LVPPVGFLLNFLFIWLVLRKTPKEMRVHSQILLQTCLLDVLFLLVLTIGTSVIFIELLKKKFNSIFKNYSFHISFNHQVLVYDGDSPAVIFDGYLVQFMVSALGMSSLFYFYHIFLLFYFFDSYSVAAQFLYRYLVLNR
jgi:hypothetical protein